MARAAAWILLAGTVALTVCGQLLLKWQVTRVGAAMPGDSRGLFLFVGRLLLNPWVIAALAGAFLASILWMLALTKLELSEAYPYTALSFVLILLTSHFVFGEPLTMGKVMGTGIVVCGIFVLAITSN
jgi:multidrug transporter EmrE-like cation transporter